jgi:hypothetical protein
MTATWEFISRRRGLRFKEVCRLEVFDWRKELHDIQKTEEKRKEVVMLN